MKRTFKSNVPDSSSESTEEKTTDGDECDPQEESGLAPGPEDFSRPSEKCLAVFFDATFEDCFMVAPPSPGYFHLDVAVGKDNPSTLLRQRADSTRGGPDGTEPHHSGFDNESKKSGTTGAEPQSASQATEDVQEKHEGVLPSVSDDEEEASSSISFGPTSSGSSVGARNTSLENPIFTRPESSSTRFYSDEKFCTIIRPPRPRSCPSVPQETSADINVSTRAVSVPNVKLQSSFEEFTPDFTGDEDDEVFRFRCSGPGLHQCRETGLVFDMKAEGDVFYRTVPWNRRLLSQHHKKPAGPLFDLTCQQQSVARLHLPHCEVRSTGGGDHLSVAHIDDDDLELIRPERITETHVVVNVTGFSGFGNVKDEDSPPDQVRALVLLFFKLPAEPDADYLMNVLLLPRNVAVRDVLRFRKKLDGDETFLEVPPHCKLQPQQVYSLSTGSGDDSVLVQPTEAEFDQESYDNYLPTFQVVYKALMKHMTLFLRDSSSTSVWERRVCLSSSGTNRSCGSTRQSHRPDERLAETRVSFIDGVSGPVLQGLLDKLLERKVLSDSEREAAEAERNRRDKARFVIDTVRRKGDAASSEMIRYLCELDPFLSEHLGFM